MDLETVAALYSYLILQYLRYHNLQRLRMLYLHQMTIILAILCVLEMDDEDFLDTTCS